MCGIFGAIIIKPTDEDLRKIERLFLALESRGTHATGCAWAKDRYVHVEKEGIPARHFVDCVLRLDQMIDERGNLHMVGHTRYTTSNIFDHQPIGDDHHVIAHNGIITQRDPVNWKRRFGLTTRTQNDSELIYAVQHQKQTHPLEFKRFQNSTIGVVELTSLGTLIGYRNFGRPLWTAYDPKKYAVFASTGEALLEAGFKDPVMCESYVETEYNIFDWDASIHMHTTVFEKVYEDVDDFGDK